MTMKHTSFAVAREFLDALQAGDADRLREVLTEDATWTVTAPSLGFPPIQGRDAIIARFTGPSNFEGGKGPTVTITRIVADQNVAAVEATGKARLKDGAEYNNRYHYALDLEGRRVKAIRHYQDSHHIANIMYKRENG
ncbi:nuclear transport factor 2 family protein [Rhodococcus sp. T2V]|uniref:nuclear transport factor 2 family protein n=1 Tax=Rhodococcus sp. T2V TaxID=3034164 RepID=UPI0023E187E3|nr:nuclear transport factor 2 family protein [Rhodococcus sp. T2V]MDF3313167.1 nuclear transport factor 2 family protein [Rhodococcus sp. T2V]